MYFHADALTDCGWQEAVSLCVPPGTKSGVYGLEIVHPEGSDTIPFYVTPATNAPRARVLFLAPTLTYQAYANHARGNYAGQLAQRIDQWGDRKRAEQGKSGSVRVELGWRTHIKKK